MYIKNKFIFIHIPKTGGNNFQSHVFDPEVNEKLISGIQDGKDRFGVRDQFTNKKHQFLSEYLDHSAIADYEFVSIVRHPVTRMFSRYYSPANHVIPRTRFLSILNDLNNKLPKNLQLDSKIFTKYIEPKFDKEKFIEMMRKSPSQSDYLSVDGKLYQKLTIIPFENYDETVSLFLERHGFSYTPTRINKGTANPNIVKLLDDDIRQEFLTGRHAKDFENFDYQLDIF